MVRGQNSAILGLGSVLSLINAFGISIFESFFGPRSVLSLMILVQQSNDGGGAYISRAHY